MICEVMIQQLGTVSRCRRCRCSDSVQCPVHCSPQNPSSPRYLSRSGSALFPSRSALLRSHGGFLRPSFDSCRSRVTWTGKIARLTSRSRTASTSAGADYRFLNPAICSELRLIFRDPCVGRFELPRVRSVCERDSSPRLTARKAATMELRMLKVITAIIAIKVSPLNNSIIASKIRTSS
jgi:hypothetical protein